MRLRGGSHPNPRLWWCLPRPRPLCTSCKTAPLSQLPRSRAKWGQRCSAGDFRDPPFLFISTRPPANVVLQDVRKGPALDSNTYQIDVLNCSIRALIGQAIVGE